MMCRRGGGDRGGRKGSVVLASRTEAPCFMPWWKLTENGLFIMLGTRKRIKAYGYVKEPVNAGNSRSGKSGGLPGS